MKKQRYKFDAEWLAAIALCNIPGLNIEKTVREHIEMDWNVDAVFKNTPFEPAWILIRAQIAQRKARNARARMRRRELKENRGLAAVPSGHNTATRINAENTAVKSAEKSTAETASYSTPGTSTPAFRSQRAMSPARHDTIGLRRQRPAVKSAFASRFRGPGLLSAVHSTGSDCKREPFGRG